MLMRSNRTAEARELLELFLQKPIGLYPMQLKALTNMGMRSIRVALAQLEAAKMVERVRGDESVPNDEGMDPFCYYRLCA